MSLTPNRDLIAQARAALRGRWWLAAGTYFVYFLIVDGLLGLPGYLDNYTGSKHLAIWNDVGTILYFIINGPFVLGLAIFWLSISRGRGARFSQLFGGFRRFWVALGTEILIWVRVLLWSILLIVPGIIAYLSYSQTFFILGDDESIGSLTALRKSKEIMQGNRWKLFCLWFRFAGWYVLFSGILAAGVILPNLVTSNPAGLAPLPVLVGVFLISWVGFLWLGPYINVSTAKFYDDLAGGSSVGAGS